MRRGELIINYLQFLWPFFMVLVIGVFSMAMSFLVESPLAYILIVFLCWFVGFGLFLKSKISVYKQGKLLSFGSAGMTKLNRFCYRAGYVVMTIALFLSLILYMVFRTKN